MQKWLIKWYPVSPAQALNVFNLEVLEVDNYCSSDYQDMVQFEFNEYNWGFERCHANPEDLVYFNNKVMYLISGHELKEAIDIFFKKLGGTNGNKES